VLPGSGGRWEHGVLTIGLPGKSPEFLHQHVEELFLPFLIFSGFLKNPIASVSSRQNYLWIVGYFCYPAKSGEV